MQTQEGCREIDSQKQRLSGADSFKQGAVGYIPIFSPLFLAFFNDQGINNGIILC